MNKFVRATRVASEFEAITIKAFLESEGITAVIKSYQVTPYGEGMTSNIMSVGSILHGSWGEILVPREKLDNAVQIIKDLRPRKKK